MARVQKILPEIQAPSPAQAIHEDIRCIHYIII